MNIIRDFIINKGKDIALLLIDSSYWICLFVCMLAIILYMAGCKKGGKVASISFVIYVLTQAIKLGLK